MTTASAEECTMSFSAILFAGVTAVAVPSWLSEQALCGYLGSANEVVVPLTEIVSPKEVT